MRMKIYFYYATEENCFETQKFETENPFGDMEQFLKDDYVDTQTIEYEVYDAKAQFEKNGFVIVELTQGQGYDIVIGVAKFGKCHEITSVISDRRREAIAMW